MYDIFVTEFNGLEMKNITLLVVNSIEILEV